MMSAKQQITVIFCCAFLLVKPAHALIPVFDWMESVPLFSQLTTTTKSLNNIRSQLTQLKETLTSVGDKVNTITHFTKDLSKFNDEIVHLKNLTSDAKKTVQKASDVGSTVQNKVDDAIEAATQKQKELTNEYVAKVNDKIGQEASSVKNSNKGKFKLPVRDDIQLTTIEEEEEEEEISDVDEDISATFAMFKQESKRLKEELNDILEDAIYILNENAKISQQQLRTLQEALANENLAVDKTEKENVQKKLAALVVHEQKVSDMGLDIVESTKNKYNREYQTKMVDGFNNYEKVVQAYLDGNATKEEMKKTESNLKEEIASINVIPDKSMIKNYQEEWQIIQKETADLAADIEKMLANKEKDNL